MGVNKKIIIGIIGVPNYDDGENNITCIFNGYKEAIIERNCIPFMISPFLSIDYYGTKLKEIPEITKKEKAYYKDILNMCDGLIIPGGNRIYNFDYFITKEALKRNMPILGTCRGLQVLASIDNGGIPLELIESNINHKQAGIEYAHNIKILDNTLLKDIIGRKIISVNSRHNYHVIKLNKFRVSAYSEDNIIEGIEDPTKKFVLGVQWHPEVMLKYDKYANRIFDRFIKACKKK